MAAELPYFQNYGKLRDMESSSVGSPIYPKEAPENKAEVLEQALDLLNTSLAQTWPCLIEKQAGNGAEKIDAKVTISSPNGASVIFLVEAKRLLATRDVGGAISQLSDLADQNGIKDYRPMLTARYLPPSTRERLEENGAAYADATGNLFLRSDQPAIYIRSVGSNRDPWRGPGRPRGTLKGAPAARVVRAVLDFTPPYSVPDLVKRSGASTGATYRVVKYLEEEGLLSRTTRGPIVDADWRQILTRWSQDYGFQQSNSVRSFLFPRGLDALVQRLRGTDKARYAVTGSLAARSIAPYAQSRLAMIYVDDITEMADMLDLRRVETGANVILAPTLGNSAFARTTANEGLTMAATSQVAVDLLTGPGRMPSEGEELLDWMERNEPLWRC